MDAVVVHGWGFDARIWNDFRAFLPDWSFHIVDLGFLCASSHSVRLEERIPEDALLIGHSLGTMWLLKHMPKSPKALVSINGFACFSHFIPERQIITMQKQLRRNPYALMQQFWGNCGAQAPCGEADLNTERLEEGLDWLLTWDMQKALGEVSCPVLALASREDLIVPAQMSKDIWSRYDLRWSEKQGHMLPLDDTRWCAEQIKGFIG